LFKVERNATGIQEKGKKRLKLEKSEGTEERW
jgi:hypothetical protein